ncbi:MAG TPA: hypothetical protein G4O01_04140 [Dehalococcoidia bacterium]|jgi:hypothetical protein|nr:hypothetical protein [Dehalococcoidia bacterium]
MNKILLIWNLLLTLLLIGIIINGCGPQYDLSAEIKANREAIEQLTTSVNSNREAINKNNKAILANKVAIESFAQTTQTAINALEASLTSYIEQYVQTYVDQAVGTK